MTPSLLPWSISKLGMYERCPASAKFRHIERLPSPRGEAAQRGTDIHGSIENFLVGKQKFVHPAVTSYLDVFLKVKRSDPDVEKKLAVNREWKPMSWDKCWGRGVIDAITDEKRTLIGWEWKSGKVWEDHQDQRRMYAIMLEAHWPDFDLYEVRTIYLDQRKRVKFKGTHENMKKHRQDFETRIQIMELDKDYSPRPGFYCRWCSYSRFNGGPCRAG